MSELRMTPARVALLRAIKAGKVERHRGWARGEKTRDVWYADGGRKTVTKPCNELYGAIPKALIRPGYAKGPSIYSPQPWELTPDGERVLAECEAKEAGL